MKIITFYSYKGGVGRTLLLANTANFLAGAGQKVVMLDLDFEAPGLPYKFGLDPIKDIKAGLVDYFVARQGRHERGESEFLGQTLASFSVPIRREDGGELTLFPAGTAPSPGYAETLGRIKWYELFHVITPEDNAKEVLPLGYRFFQELIEVISTQLRPDFILIDSRTGLTEIGALALHVLPNMVVALLFNNPENLAAMKELLAAIMSYSRAVKEPTGRGRTEILPVLTRIPETDEPRSDTQIAEEVQETLNRALRIRKIDEKLPRPLLLHSDVRIQLKESVLLGGKRTLNESLLLRDYLRFFKQAGLIEPLPPRIRAHISRLAEINESYEWMLQDRLGRDIRWSIPGDPGGRVLERVGRRLERGGDGTSSLICVKPAYHRRELGYERLHEFCDRLCENVAARASALLPSKELLKVAQKSLGQATWDHLMTVRILEGEYDLCTEIFFLSPTRSYMVGLVQIGWIRTLSLCFMVNGPVKSIVDSFSQASKWTVESIVRTLLKSLPKLQIGVLGESAASNETVRSCTGIMSPERIRTCSSEQDLADWLRKDGDLKIAFVDHVVASSLKKTLPRAAETIAFTTPPCLVAGLSVDFEHPIPVGFPYPHGDNQWRKVISWALAETLCKNPQLWIPRDDESSGSEKGNLDTVPGELATNGIDVLSMELLCESLLLDMTVDNGLVFRDRFLEAGFLRKNLY